MFSPNKTGKQWSFDGATEREIRDAFDASGDEEEGASSKDDARPQVGVMVSVGPRPRACGCFGVQRARWRCSVRGEGGAGLRPWVLCEADRGD